MKTEDAVAMFARWAKEERVRRDVLQRLVRITLIAGFMAFALGVLSVLFIDSPTAVDILLRAAVPIGWFAVAGAMMGSVKHSSGVILRYDNAAVLVAHGHVP